MSISKNWLPKRLADLLVMFQNVGVKINGYKTILPLTPAQVDRIMLICDEFVSVYNYVTQARATTESLVEWRDNIFYGTPTGDPAPAPPTFPSYSAVTGAFIGIITEFREFRELIVASPGYTKAIGEDLMIVAPDTEKLLEAETEPTLKISTEPGYKVIAAGSMQGMDAMRIEYQRVGATTWNIAAFVTKLPAEFTITPATPGEPENGRIRAIFIKKNDEYGVWSPEYAVTVS